MKYANNSALGLAQQNRGNILLFSRAFLENKYNVFLADGYQLTSGEVEYIVYWYDRKDEKEFKIVLPKLQFTKS
jgi:ATP-dependent DNA helicase RecQ